MWDPRSYTDSDFGLGEDEEFEPDEVGESEIDITVDRHIMTVLDPIFPEDLGICLPVEHVLIDPPNAQPDRQLNDPRRALEELTSFVTAGGKAIVDSTDIEQGRDLVGLFDIARRVPVHLICSTGPGIGLDGMLSEIREGIGPRSIRPGVIQSTNNPEPLSTAMKVSARTGLPLFIDGIPAAEAMTTAATTIVLSHQTPDRDVLTRILALGTRIAFTGIGSPMVGHDESIARLLVDLNNDGFGRQLLISQQLKWRSASHAWGGQPGLVYLLERFTLILMEAGAEAGFVRQLLIDNPAAALTISPPILS